ncbi:MAG: cobalamin-binding protein [Rubrobacter sp.]|nr:cobalamin-binding protein [Rubrobacter sp.]
MRIASLLPSATEMVHFAAGDASSLVGVTHECDFPKGVESLPKLTASKINHHEMTSSEIDEAVGNLSDSGSIYALDARLLEELSPDLVVTQGLCEVCAVSESVVERAVSGMEVRPDVLSLNPTSLDGVLEDSMRVGDALGRGDETRRKIASLRERLDHVEKTVAGKDRPRVGCVEWLDPPFSAGHWVPEMVEIAGGGDVFARPGEASRRMEWSEVADSSPDILVLMPCGFDVERTMEEVHILAEKPGWKDIPAVKNGRVWVVDANSYFSRPAPRIVDGVEILAKILHPDAFPEAPDSKDALRFAPERAARR